MYVDRGKVRTRYAELKWPINDQLISAQEKQDSTQRKHWPSNGSEVSDIEKLCINMRTLVQTCMSGLEGFKFNGDPM